ncbi:MAG: flippase [Deltaproteobacteria bacterium]|nr:flippase [Deltaproteobacteria bacterium]
MSEATGTATRRVIRNSLWLLAQPILLGLASLALLSYGARELGKVGLGRFSAATAFVFLFVAFSGLGLSMLATRDIARNREEGRVREYVARLSGLRLSVAGIVAVLALVVAYLSGQGDETGGLVYLAVLVIPLEAVVRTFQDLFIALERARVVALAGTVGAIARIVSSFGALALGFGVWGFLCGWLVADVANALFALWFARGLAVRPVLEWDFSWSAVKRGFVFYISGIVSTGHQRLDVLILASAAGHAEVGIYAAAVGLARRLVIIPESLGTATFAGVSGAALVDREVAREVTARSMTLGLLFGIPIAAGCWTLSGPIVSALFGPEFSTAVRPLAIGVWALPLWCASYVALFSLTAVDREWTVFWIATVITVTTVIGLVLPGDRLDATWAAVAMVAGQAVGTSLHLVVIRLALGPVLRLGDLARIAVATAAMSATMVAARRFMSDGPGLTAVVGAVLLGAMVYLAVATALGVAPWAELLGRRGERASGS